MSPSEIILVVFGALLFLAIGSFTCVIIDRLPIYSAEPNDYGEHWDTRPWREVLGGNSRCSSCGEPVRPYDNIPIVSWMVLRGRCRGCDERIPGFHPAVELLSPVLFLLAVWRLGFGWHLLPVLWLVPVGLAVSVIDLRTLIVPTRVVWPALGVSVVLTIGVSAIEGQWRWILSALIGLVVLAAPLFAIWFIVPKGMGFGDVRLSTLLGWTVGFYAGSDLAMAAMLSLICLALAAVVGLVIGLVGLGVKGAKAKVPFGPALCIAAYACAILADPILTPLRA